MLGKLMKYEFKATGRIFLPLFGAMLVMSIVSQMLSGLRTGTPYVISLMLSTTLIAAAFVMMLVITIQRFYKNFMGNEGYLMHTLPVNTGKLIWSKLLVAMIWSIVCAAVVFVAIFILAINEADFQSLLHSFDDINLPSWDAFRFMIEFIVAMLVSLMSSILCLYACMALSMLFNKHRVAISFAFFIATTTIVQILTAVVLFGHNSSLSDFLFNTKINTDILNLNSSTVMEQSGNLAVAHGFMLWYILIIALIGAGFYGLTHYMLKHRLNLQ